MIDFLNLFLSRLVSIIRVSLLLLKKLLGTLLNDFIFCPRSIYFHKLFGTLSSFFYHNASQVRGKKAHKNIDKQKYSSSNQYLTGISVYSELYQLCGKIDIYDQKILIERKNRISFVYEGYLLQLYVQYFCLKEMGYEIQKLKLHSLEDNKNYFYPPPSPDNRKYFESILEAIRTFKLEDFVIPNKNKCNQCVYSDLCDISKKEN